MASHLIDYIIHKMNNLESEITSLVVNLIANKKSHVLPKRTEALQVATTNGLSGTERRLKANMV